jgi:hypothetical protein
MASGTGIFLSNASILRVPITVTIHDILSRQALNLCTTIFQRLLGNLVPKHQHLGPHLGYG